MAYWYGYDRGKQADEYPRCHDTKRCLVGLKLLPPYIGIDGRTVDWERMDTPGWPQVKRPKCVVCGRVIKVNEGLKRNAITGGQ